MRILLVEDDRMTARSLELALTSASVKVFTTSQGEDAIGLARLYAYDLILLDLHLPDMSGHEVLRQLRLAKVETPVLMLTGDDSTESKIRSFGFGADDYVTKPFSSKELLARVHAIVRRSQGHAQALIQIGLLSVNTGAKTVKVRGQPVHLTAKEYQILELLALRKGITITKEMFLNHLYGGLDEPDLKIIDVFICKLRKKIAEANHGDSVIETVWGRGYVLRNLAPEQDAVMQPAAIA